MSLHSLFNNPLSNPDTFLSLNFYPVFLLLWTHLWIFYKPCLIKTDSYLNFHFKILITISIKSEIKWLILLVHWKFNHTEQLAYMAIIFNTSTQWIMNIDMEYCLHKSMEQVYVVHKQLQELLAFDHLLKENQKGFISQCHESPTMFIICSHILASYITWCRRNAMFLGTIYNFVIKPLFYDSKPTSLVFIIAFNSPNGHEISLS